MARCIDDVGLARKNNQSFTTTVPAGAAVRFATAATARLLVTNCAQNGRFNCVDPKYGISSQLYVRPLITVWADGMIQPIAGKESREGKAAERGMTAACIDTLHAKLCRPS
jgi:hypothetical protein